MADDARRRVLAAVRGALRDVRADARAPVSGDAPPPASGPGSLLDSFTAGAREAGAIVRTAPAAELPARVAEILVEEQATSAVFSPSVTGLLPLRQWTGRAIVRTAAERDALFAADAGVTRASWGLADTGTLVLESSAAEHRLDSLVPPVHVAVLDASRLLADMAALFAAIGRRAFEDHSAITLVRGPSRTADVELTLSIGVHGPKRLYVVIGW